MIELVFIACMISSPDICEERTLVYVETSRMACTLQAQPYLADWTASHPQWSVRQWKCQVPQPGRKT